MSLMHEGIRTHAGSGPGQIRYEVYFNVTGYGQRFELFPDTVQRQTAQVYRDLW